MSVLGTIFGGLRSNATKLTNIPRGYYLQGLALIKASRGLHSSDEDIKRLNSEQLSELHILMNRVGEFLEATITDTVPKDPSQSPARLPKTPKEINALFKTAVETIDQYQTKYQIKWKNKEIDFQHWIRAAQEGDVDAAKHIEATQAIVDKKKRWFSGIMTKTIGINFFLEEDLTKVYNDKVKTTAEYKTYDIEGSASLDGVLLRLKMRKEEFSVSMSCNPQFYKCFPLKRSDFKKYGDCDDKRSSKPKIFPFTPWITINDALKLLKAVNMDFLQLVLDNDKYRTNDPDSLIRNRWAIEGGHVFKGIFGALELYDGTPRRIEAPPSFPQPVYSSNPSLGARSMPGTYPQNANPPNQHSWPQPSATQNQRMPQPVVTSATARLQHGGPYQSNISAISQPSIFSDDSSSLPPAPPPTNDSSPSVNTIQTDSTVTLPVPEVSVRSEPADAKKGWISRSLGTFGGGKKQEEKKKEQKTQQPLRPNQQESQLAAPSSSSGFLRPPPMVQQRKRDLVRNFVGAKATKGPKSSGK